VKSWESGFSRRNQKTTKDTHSAVGVEVLGAVGGDDVDGLGELSGLLGLDGLADRDRSVGGGPVGGEETLGGEVVGGEEGVKLSGCKSVQLFVV
jgi:hypothetical protein